MDYGDETTVKLYDFWRSSAAYRVRIAFNLKGLTYESIPTDLTAGAQRTEAYLAENPQGLVPMLDADGARISQTLAIIDWLDSKHPEPRLIPADPLARAAELSKALAIIADIHPINNLRVLKYLKNELGLDQDAIDQWIRHWISTGFASLEAMVDPGKPFLSGDAPGLADCCLVPQMYNARRFETQLEAFPKLVRIDAACTALPAFMAAHPDAVKGE
jgi:maleylacetoacetate isomerase